MENSFLKLKREKQEKIIRSAIKEFATYSYDKASTDRIVKEAGISKGSLFGYFGSKSMLYKDIIEQVFKTSSEYITRYLKKAIIKDFYEALLKIAAARYEYMEEFPMEAKVLMHFQHQNLKDEKLVLQLKKKYEVWERKIIEEYVIPHLDSMKLRPNVKKEEVVFITYVIMEALLRQQGEMKYLTETITEKDTEKERARFEKYLDLIKYGVCEKV